MSTQQPWQVVLIGISRLDSSVDVPKAPDKRKCLNLGEIQIVNKSKLETSIDKHNYWKHRSTNFSKVCIRILNMLSELFETKKVEPNRFKYLNVHGGREVEVYYISPTNYFSFNLIIVAVKNARAYISPWLKMPRGMIMWVWMI